MRIAEVAIRVRDLETSRAFYEETLGFRFHVEQPGVVFLEVGPLDSPLGRAGHPQLLALFDRGQEVDTGTSSFDHIAFEIPEERYERERTRFHDMGMIIRERAWPDSLLWKGRSFFFRDPDGNVIELITSDRAM